MSKPNAAQRAFRDRKIQAPVSTLSGFETLAKNIPQSEWLNTPKLVEYVRQNFETRYTPEFMISALGLQFTDPEMNDSVFQKQSKLLDRVTEIPPFENIPAEASTIQ